MINTQGCIVTLDDEKIKTIYSLKLLDHDIYCLSYFYEHGQKEFNTQECVYLSIENEKENYYRDFLVKVLYCVPSLEVDDVIRHHIILKIK